MAALDPARKLGDEIRSSPFLGSDEDGIAEVEQLGDASTPARRPSVLEQKTFVAPPQSSAHLKKRRSTVSSLPPTEKQQTKVLIEKLDDGREIRMWSENERELLRKIRRWKVEEIDAVLGSGQSIDMEKWMTICCCHFAEDSQAYEIANIALNYQWDMILKMPTKTKPKEEAIRLRFLDALIAQQLYVELEVSYDPSVTFVKIFAPFQTLAIRAEKLEMKYPLRLTEQETLNKWPNTTIPFRTAYLNEYEGADQSSKHQWEIHKEFFSRSRRALMVYDILQATEITISHTTDGGLNALLNRGTFTHYFPLHDGPIRNRKTKEFAKNKRATLYAKWVSTSKYAQPVNDIKNYFGEAVGFYFMWITYYTSALVWAGIIGIIPFAYGVYIAYRNRVNINNVTDDINAVGFFDNALTLPFSFCMCIWSTLTLESWKRRQAKLAFEWDMVDLKHIDQVRPEWVADGIRISPVTGNDELYASNFTAGTRIGTSAVVIFALAILVIAQLASVILFRAWATYSWQNKTAASVSASVLNLLVIMLTSSMYAKIARRLTNFENHKTVAKHDASLIFKNGLFGFINSFTSMFYLAFIKPNWTTELLGIPGLVDTCVSSVCMYELGVQLAIIMSGSQTIALVQRLLLPIISRRWRRRGVRTRKKLIKNMALHYRARSLEGVQRSLEHMNIRTEVPQEPPSPKQTKDTVNSHFVPQWAKDDVLTSADGLTWAYQNLLIQFGYITLFVAAFPLAPIFAVFANLLEVKADAFLMLAEFQRPIGFRAANIGAWQRLLTLLSMASVMTNAAMIAFTSGYTKNYYLAAYPATTAQSKLARLALQLGFILAFEHAVYGIKLLIIYLVPDTPEAVQTAIARQRYRLDHVRRHRTKTSKIDTKKKQASSPSQASATEEIKRTNVLSTMAEDAEIDEQSTDKPLRAPSAISEQQQSRADRDSKVEEDTSSSSSSGYDREEIVPLRSRWRRGYESQSDEESVSGVEPHDERVPPHEELEATPAGKIHSANADRDQDSLIDATPELWRELLVEDSASPRADFPMQYTDLVGAEFTGQVFMPEHGTYMLDIGRNAQPTIMRDIQEQSVNAQSEDSSSTSSPSGKIGVDSEDTDVLKKGSKDIQVATSPQNIPSASSEASLDESSRPATPTAIKTKVGNKLRRKNLKGKSPPSRNLKIDLPKTGSEANPASLKSSLAHSASPLSEGGIKPSIQAGSKSGSAHTFGEVGDAAKKSVFEGFSGSAIELKASTPNQQKSSHPRVDQLVSPSEHRNSIPEATVVHSQDLLRQQSESKTSQTGLASLIDECLHVYSSSQQKIDPRSQSEQYLDATDTAQGHKASGTSYNRLGITSSQPEFRPISISRVNLQKFEVEPLKASSQSFNLLMPSLDDISQSQNHRPTPPEDNPRADGSAPSLPLLATSDLFMPSLDDIRPNQACTPIPPDNILGVTSTAKSLPVLATSDPPIMLGSEPALNANDLLVSNSSSSNSRSSSSVGVSVDSLPFDSISLPVPQPVSSPSPPRPSLPPEYNDSSHRSISPPRKMFGHISNLSFANGRPVSIVKLEDGANQNSGGS